MPAAVPALRGLFFAPAFDVTAYAKSVDYEFASTAYAIDSAAENYDAGWLKLKGQDIKPRRDANDRT